MFDKVAFTVEINDLIREGQTKQAEERMLRMYSELKASNSLDELETVVFLLGHFYSNPDTKDLEKGEVYFLEREVLSPGAYTKCQTALFYFYVLGDSAKTIKKVEEINSMLAIADRASYYSALTLRGQAFINLEMPGDANKVLEELLSLVKTNPRGLPYGDEMNLLEAAISNPILAPRCREILDLIIPRIRSQEYVERAKALLKSA